MAHHIKWEPDEIYRARPTGTLCGLRDCPGPCSVCRMILHLFTSKTSHNLLQWSRTQEASVLREFRYTLEATGKDEVSVSVAWPDSNKFRLVGHIRRCVDDVEANSELVSSRFFRLKNFGKHPGDLDFRTIKSWLKECDKGHQTCQSIRAQRSGQKHHHIRLIDVEAYKIISSTTAERYAALSYVWGNVIMLRATLENVTRLERNRSLSNHENEIPSTIKDAIKVTARLGLRYLWVDALCIVQDNALDKHMQIAHMHEIYSTAYVTLVQQSGYDARAGLPGVNADSRSPLLAQAGALVSEPTHDPTKALTSTVHGSRGWTLQEILVSKRCLHFFDKHITMICAETVRQDCDHLYEKIADSKRKMSIASRNAIPWELNPLQSYRLFSGSTQSQLVDWLCYFGVFARIVTTYSARTLSYDSDILHAFSGLAAALSELKAGGNYFGLPEISFDLALLWVPVGSTIKRRREGESGILGDDVFPSWSWAGWNGEVSYNCCETSGKPQFSDIKITSCVNSFCIINAEGKTCVLKNEPWPGPATPVGRPNLNLLPQFLSDGEFGTNSKDGPNHRPGMLLFWAEEAGPDQLRCVFPSSLEPLPDRENKPQYSYLFTRYGYKQCGIVALMSSQFLKAGDTIEREKYSFVLMSECEKPFSRWFRDEGGTFTVVDDVASRMTSDKEIGRVLNVLLVRQKGDCYERLGCGQVAAQHWMPLKRRRRFFKLI